MTTTNQLRVVGPACLVDSDGIHLCGPAALHKGSSGRELAKMRDRWEAAMRDAGMFEGIGTLACNTLLKSDANYVCDCRILCATDGEWHRRGHGVEVRTGVRDEAGNVVHYVDFGHVVADALGGVFCSLNALPVRSDANAADGDARPYIHKSFNVERYIYAQMTAAIAAIPRSRRARIVNAYKPF